MKQFYTLKNIYDLLVNNFIDCKWNYEIYDDIAHTKKVASIEDFTKSLGYLVKVVLINCNGSESILGVNVTNFNFELYRYVARCCSGSSWDPSANFTNQWRELLINEYGEKYKRQLSIYVEMNEKISPKTEQYTSDYVNNFNKNQDVFSND